MSKFVTINEAVSSFDDIVKWLADRNEAIRVDVREISFKSLDNWLFDEKTHNLRHQSGKFFSIDGLKVKKDSDLETKWCQPLINQPEVAILALGIIKKRPEVITTEKGDEIAIRSMMYLSLSFDHRVVDGFLGGSFVRRVADYFEQFDTNRKI